MSNNKIEDSRRIECLKCQARFMPKSEREKYCSKCKYNLEGIWKSGRPYGNSIDEM